LRIDFKHLAYSCATARNLLTATIPEAKSGRHEYRKKDVVYPIPGCELNREQQFHGELPRASPPPHQAMFHARTRYRWLTCAWLIRPTH